MRDKLYKITNEIRNTNLIYSDKRYDTRIDPKSATLQKYRVWRCFVAKKLPPDKKSEGKTG